ncbi:glycosyltransferase family 2 protein [Salipiger sp.]|uniref:glycosyltransferase family 2 protein n=1 Tax=Salipiger sp. TaxID=2078585 RepID=UPI003A9773C0
MADQLPAPDVSVRNNDLSNAPGLPLILVVRNERPFLPDFLGHYRALGVKRFFILDDASNDGTPDYLLEQPDVCLLSSTSRYGDIPPAERRPGIVRVGGDLRMIHVWRTELMDRFCMNQWALQCDIDEFVLLPDGKTLNDVISRLEAEGANGAWAGMIDLYPRDIADLAAYPASGFTWPAAEWFFDGVRHFSLRPNKSPRHRYVGVRHRLDVAYAGKEEIGLKNRLKLRLLGARKAPSGTLVKPLIQKWRPGQAFYSSHRTTLALSHRILLPLLHYRYTPAMLRKLEWAPQTGGYSKGNKDYLRIETMLSKMREENASFLGPHSVPLTGWSSLEKTGNAVW